MSDNDPMPPAEWERLPEGGLVPSGPFREWIARNGPKPDQFQDPEDYEEARAALRSRLNRLPKSNVKAPASPPQATPAGTSDEPSPLVADLMRAHGLSRENAEAWASMV